jgi:hypothetical protein
MKQMRGEMARALPDRARPRTLTVLEGESSAQLKDTVGCGCRNFADVGC